MIECQPLFFDANSGCAFRTLDHRRHRRTRVARFLRFLLACVIAAHTSPSLAAVSTACALDGVYALSAHMSVTGGPAELAGYVRYIPPAGYPAGASGVARLSVVIQGGNGARNVLEFDFPYWIDPSGGVSIGDGIIGGYLAQVVDERANAFVFIAEPAFTRTTGVLGG